MIKYLEAHHYKGIKQVILNDLKHTNVITGKNSSGKSSILESLTNPNFYSIGIEIMSSESLIQKFKTQSSQYSTPYPSSSNNWFTDTIRRYIKKRPIWFGSEINLIVNELKLEQKLDSYLKGFSTNTFNLEHVIANEINEITPEYKPVLIPPKRLLKPSIAINLDEELTPSGGGVLNHLFYLKNQDQRSTEFVIFQKIYRAFNDITDFRFNIIPDKQNKIRLVFQINGQWLGAEDCGLGLRDILIIITLILATNYTFYLIEEPESHLHANFQKRLINFIKSITNKQFLLSTHSNIFLDVNNADKVYYSWFDDEVKASDETSLSQIVNSLGYSIIENLSSDAIILTEGPSDIPIIQRILKWIGALDNFNIKLWPLGGDIMASTDLSLFSNRTDVYAIIDSDPGSTGVRNAFIKNCKDHKIKHLKLDRYSIENYFTLEALRTVLGEKIPKTITQLDKLKSVDEQIGYKSKNKSIKGINHQIISCMKLSDIEGTDLGKFLIEIHNDLKTKHTRTEVQ